MNVLRCATFAKYQKTQIDTWNFQIEEQVPIVECLNVRPEPPVRLRSRNVGRKNRRKPKLEPQRMRGESLLGSEGYA